MGDIELEVLQKLAKISLITIYYPVFNSFIMTVQTDILCWQGHSPAPELREYRLCSYLLLISVLRRKPCHTGM